MIPAEVRPASDLQMTRWAATSQNLPWAEMEFGTRTVRFVDWELNVLLFVADYTGSLQACFPNENCVAYLDGGQVRALQLRIVGDELRLAECHRPTADTIDERRDATERFYRESGENLYLSVPPYMCRLTGDTGYRRIPW